MPPNVSTRAKALSNRLRRMGVPVVWGGSKSLEMPGFSFMTFGRYGWGEHNNKSARLAVRQMVQDHPERLAVAIQMDPLDGPEDVIVSMRAKDWAVLASAYVQTDPDRFMIHTKE